MKKGTYVVAETKTRKHGIIKVYGTVVKVFKSTVGGSKKTQVAQIKVDQKKSVNYRRYYPTRLHTTLSLAKFKELKN